MTIYTCWDESGTRVEIEATTARRAARDYVRSGDCLAWDSTYWVSVRVALGDETPETVKIPVHPDAPECVDDEEGHDWQSPYSVVGGIEENPGVWGNGGGVRIRTVCAHCGAYRTVDTWAQDPEDGEQGLESREYEDADSDSLEWVQASAATRRLAECGDLDGLLDLLQDRDYSQHLDWTDLPTYGGEAPRDTAGVWSWDETRLLVGSCADDVRIADRGDA